MVQVRLVSWHLKSIQHKTGKALRTFTRISDELTGQNEALAKIVDEIDTEVERLANLRGAARVSMRENTTIVKRINDFISE